MHGKYLNCANDTVDSGISVKFRNSHFKQFNPGIVEIPTLLKTCTLAHVHNTHFHPQAVLTSRLKLCYSLRFKIE